MAIRQRHNDKSTLSLIDYIIF